MKRQEPTKMEQSASGTLITCPTCKGPVRIPTTGAAGRPRSFPFCSERCKLVDLNAWLDADYRIEVRPNEESEDALGGTEGPA